MVTRNMGLRAAGVVLALCGGVVFAQPGDHEAAEVAALGGGMFGAGSHVAAGASAGLGVARHLMVLLDTTFVPMGNDTIRRWPPSSMVNRSYLFDFGIDCHIRVPVKERWVPYGIIGAGVLWNMVRQNTTDSQGVTVETNWDHVGGAFHTGGGLRYFVKDNWGVRSEVKIVINRNTYTQVMAGVFYTFPAI